MNEELPQIDIEKLLERMAPPSTPDESFVKASPALKEVCSWHRRNAALVLGGLQTEPGYHANDIRLDWLQRLILAKAEGKKKPGPKDFQRALNEGLDKANVLRLEDPIEDTFCDLIATREGNFRILLGRWEAAAAYTQTVLDAFGDLPEGPQKKTALEAAYALLRLSDAICERAGVDRGTASGGIPMDRIAIPAKEGLKDLARRMAFKNCDLHKLGINPAILQQFCLRAEYFPFVSDRVIGDTPLEFCPLLPGTDGIDVLAPTNMSMAVRAVLIGTAVAGNMGEALQRRLLVRQESLSEETVFWPGASIKLSPPNKLNLRASVCKYDHGSYLHVIQIPTLFDGFPDEGFGAVRRLPDATNAAIAADIERFWEFLATQGDCRRSASVLLLSGWGTPHIVAPPIKEESVPGHWQYLPLSFADAAVLGACDNGKFKDILRLMEQVGRLEKDGFAFANPNGLLNLFGFWRTTEGNLVPEHMWETMPPVNLMLSVDDVLKPRLEALRRQDRRALPLPEGGYKVVQRKEFGDELKPIYASPEDLTDGRLSGAIAFAGRTWWIESEAKEGVDRNWQYQVWNAILEWLSVVGPKLADSRADLFPEGSYRISVALPQSEGVKGVSSDAEASRPLSECIEVRRESGSNVSVVEIGDDWALFLRETENRAEVDLVAAVLEGAADGDHAECSRVKIAGLVEAAIGSKDWRWLHAQGSNDPLQRLAGHGLVAPFRRISFSAHSLVKCGSVWSFRDRALGGKIEGEAECREFLKAYRDNMLDSLITDIRRFDRRWLATAGARSYHAARYEARRWRSTIRAQRAIRGVAADVAAFKRLNEVNAVIRAAKAICEIAACEAPLKGGITPARAELDEMYAKALLLFGNGQLFAAIRGELIAPSLRISPGGDVLGEREIFSRLLEPGANWLHSRLLDRADKDYGSDKIVNEEQPPEKLAWEEGLRAAVEAEYSISAEGYVDFQFVMPQLAESKGQDVFVARHSELLAALKSNAAYSKEDAGGLLKRLTLRSRPSWGADLSEAEINLSRFDRRFSLINRPLLAIDDADDPTVVVAPGFIADSVMYCISGLHRGDLNNTFWESAEARSYAGARGDAVGHEFEENVAQKLREIGLEAESGCKLSKLLNLKVSDELGNIDVFALTKNRKRVWVIEAKDLRLCRTEAEVAARLSDFRGRMLRDSKGREKPDRLLRHMRRVGFLRSHSAALAKRLKLDAAPEVKGLLVVDCPQPMNFHMLEDVPDATSVFLDAIGEFNF